jgi:hypothetical protein
MDLPRSKTFLRPISEISLAKCFVTGSIVTLSFLSVSCSEEEEEKIVYTNHVHTTIQEINPNEFKITDEQVMEGDQSRVYIHYKDGTMDNISLDTMEYHLAHKEMPYQHFSEDLAAALVASSFGAMLTPDHQRLLMQKNRNSNDFERRVLARGINELVYYYIDRATAEKSSSITQKVQSSRISVPSGSSRGFFGSFRGSGRG